MISAIFEIQEAPPSERHYFTRNPFQRCRIMLRFRDAMISAHGEGPYLKAYLSKSEHPEAVLRQVADDLAKKWPAKRCAYAELIVRRPRQIAEAEHRGGCKPLWEALKWAGWCVDVGPKWLHVAYKPQISGDDPKTVLQVHLPQTDAEEEALRTEMMQEA